MSGCAIAARARTATKRSAWMLGDGGERYVVFLLAGLIAAEFLISRLSGRPAYDAASTEENLGIAAGWLVFAALSGLLTVLVIKLGNSVAPVHFGGRALA